MDRLIQSSEYNVIMGQNQTKTVVWDGIKPKIDGESIKKMQNELTDLLKPNLDSAILKQSQKIKQWKCGQLWLSNQFQINPFDMLKAVKFGNLRKIGFVDSHIQTIEPIARIKAHNLQHIVLYQNNITDISSLKKLCSKQIKLLVLSLNQIRQADSLILSHFKALQLLTIEQYKPKIHNHQIRSICFIVKLSVVKNGYIEIYSKKRIREGIVIKAFKSKHEGITVLTMEDGEFQ